MEKLKVKNTGNSYEKTTDLPFTVTCDKCKGSNVTLDYYHAYGDDMIDIKCDDCDNRADLYE